MNPSPTVSTHSLAEIDSAYAAAALAQADLDFYATPDWFRTMGKTCLDTGEEAVFLAAPGLILPLRRQGAAAGGLSNFYSCRFTPPGLETCADAAGMIAAMARHLRRAGIGTLRFDALDAEPVRIVTQGLRRAGWLVQALPQFGNWYLKTKDLAFDLYWDQRPGQLRNTGRRRYRALVERGGAEAVCYSAADEADTAIAAYEAVYARGWQPPEPYPDFTPTLIRTGLAAGEVQVWCLWLDNKPVAAQIWVRRHDRATIFKLAYDQDWARQSAGTVLTMAAMRAALEDGGLSEIDFGWGDDDYKQRWLPERRQRYRVAAYNPRSLLGLRQTVLQFLPSQAKQFLKK